MLSFTVPGRIERRAPTGSKRGASPHPLRAAAQHQHRVRSYLQIATIKHMNVIFNHRMITSNIYCNWYA